MPATCLCTRLYACLYVCLSVPHRRIVGCSRPASCSGPAAPGVSREVDTALLLALRLLHDSSERLNTKEETDFLGTLTRGDVVHLKSDDSHLPYPVPKLYRLCIGSISASPTARRPVASYCAASTRCFALMCDPHPTTCRNTFLSTACLHAQVHRCCPRRWCHSSHMPLVLPLL